MYHEQPVVARGGWPGPAHPDQGCHEGDGGKSGNVATLSFWTAILAAELDETTRPPLGRPGRRKAIEPADPPVTAARGWARRGRAGAAGGRSGPGAWSARGRCRGTGRGSRTPPGR